MFYTPSTDKENPVLSKQEAEEYTVAVITKAAMEAVRYPYDWTRGYSGNNFWAKVTPEFKAKVVRIGGKHLHNNMLAAMGTNKHVKAGKEAISRVRCEDAMREAIADRIDLCVGDLVMPESPTVDDSSGVKAAIAYGNVVGRSLAVDLKKAIVEELKRDFVPDSIEELELFKSEGVVPKDFLSRDQVAAIYGPCGDEMAKSGMLLIRESRFVADIGRRVAVDMYGNAETWAKAILDDAPEFLDGFAKAEDAADFDMSKCQYTEGVEALQKMHKDATVKADKKKKKRKGKGKAEKAATVDVIGSPLTLPDFLKAHPSATIKSWADKMKKEGGEHPHKWCTGKAGFASDPNAFCAAVHMEAFGMTPVERTAKKKGGK